MIHGLSNEVIISKYTNLTGHEISQHGLLKTVIYSVFQLQ